MRTVFWEMKESKETMMVPGRALSMLNKILVALDKIKEARNISSKVVTPSTLKAGISIETNMEISITDNKATARQITTPGSRDSKTSKEPRTSKNSSREVMIGMNR